MQYCWGGKKIQTHRKVIFGPDFHQGALHKRFSQGTETRCMFKNLHVLNKRYLTCIPREHKL